MSENEFWSTSFLIDKLKQCLAMNAKLIINHETGQITEYRKYYIQALDMQRIGALNPSMVPSFLIYLSDLPEKMKLELQKLEDQERRFIILQVVARLFEDVNSRLYHTSISRVLKVRLVR